MAGRAPTPPVPLCAGCPPTRSTRGRSAPSPATSPGTVPTTAPPALQPLVTSLSSTGFTGAAAAVHLPVPPLHPVLNPQQCSQSLSSRSCRFTKCWLHSDSRGRADPSLATSPCTGSATSPPQSPQQPPARGPGVRCYTNEGARWFLRCPERHRRHGGCLGLEQSVSQSPFTSRAREQAKAQRLAASESELRCAFRVSHLRVYSCQEHIAHSSEAWESARQR